MEIGGRAQFCENCPRKNLCAGPVAQATQHNVDAGFFSVRDTDVGVDVSLGTHFFDETGNEADWFPPHSTEEDIANCTGLEVDYKTGFFNLKVVKDCGAFVTAVHRFRESIDGSPYPK